MTSLFKWIAVHVLKNKLSYRCPWQTFFSVESDISYFFHWDSIIRLIVAPDLAKWQGI